MDPPGDFYFMEMNTRIQVEHPVTEMVTGIDLVKAQLEIASGEPLGYTQEDVIMSGHAIECRINAENPAFNFAPSPGKIQNLLLPSGGMGLRVDSAMYSGYSIPPYYDSMIAKVIVHGENRFDALMKMQRALNEIVTEGIITNAEFQLDLITHDNVLTGDYDTSFYKKHFYQIGSQKAIIKKNAARAVLLPLIRGVSKWHYLKRKITFALIQIVLMQMMHQRSLLFQIICGQNALLVSEHCIQKKWVQKNLSALWL